MVCGGLYVRETRKDGKNMSWVTLIIGLALIINLRSIYYIREINIISEKLRAYAWNEADIKLVEEYADEYISLPLTPCILYFWKPMRCFFSPYFRRDVLGEKL